jgi:DtxR family Mn-dependent transcriptional regulator
MPAKMREETAMAEPVELSATLEDYLETMRRVTAEKGAARVRDIAAALDVHKSTVTGALRSLSEKGLVDYAPYEIATLTPQGERIARRIARRHEVIRSFLMDVLSLDEDLAEANACRMEHGLDREVLERLRLFAEFVKRCPHCGQERLQAFRDYFEQEGNPPGDETPIPATQEGD